MSIKAPKIKRFSFWWFFPIATVIGFAFSTISAVLSSTSAYGQFDGAHWGLQFGVAFAAGRSSSPPPSPPVRRALPLVPFYWPLDLL